MKTKRANEKAPKVQLRRKSSPGKTSTAVKSVEIRPSPAIQVIDMVPLVLKLKSILVPLDFSAASEKALTYAVPLAKQFGAKITLLHVAALELYPNDFGFIPVDDAKFNRKAKERLELLGARVIAPELLERTLVRKGVPFHEITNAAKQLHADLIVINTHGYTGLKHVFMGSTAERVVRHAPCPVLVVREREHEFV
jgi:universal stress protein A